LVFEIEGSIGFVNVGSGDGIIQRELEVIAGDGRRFGIRNSIGDHAEKINSGS
jgi:hypothetical protein